MTPKEKAVELVNQYLVADYTDINHEGLKQCSLIAVDELIKAFRQLYANCTNARRRVQKLTYILPFKSICKFKVTIE